LRRFASAAISRMTARRIDGSAGLRCSIDAHSVTCSPGAILKSVEFVLHVSART
jgi:hypothetical protein